jgi:hypothetical protein
VATYAFVNLLVALILGWMLAGEDDHSADGDCGGGDTDGGGAGN